MFVFCNIFFIKIPITLLTPLVITPNILLSNSKTASGEEAFLAIRVIRQMLRFQHDLWPVPPSIVKALSNLDPELLLENQDSTSSPFTWKQSEEIIKQYKKEILKSKNLVAGSPFEQEIGGHGLVS